MRYVALHTAEIVGASLLLLALAALPAHGQSLGEVTAATGVHGTLSRQSGMSASGTIGSVKSRLAKSTGTRDRNLASADMGFGAKPSRGKSAPSRSSGGSRGGSGGRGSWVSAESTSRGPQSSAWAQGGSGWATGGGGRTPTRRPRS
jgi:hypothetical protein